MKKLSIIICLICLILCFSGCREADGKVTTTNTSVSTTENIVETTEKVTEAQSTTVKATEVTTSEVTEKEEAITVFTSVSESSSEAFSTKPQTTTKEAKKENTCTIEIDCKTIFANSDKLKKKAVDKVPSDGIILEAVTVTVNEGDTVLDVLLRICEEKGVAVSYTEMPMFNSCYIEGIHGIYEKDCGGASGWMYSVNGAFPQMGANAYSVSEGDRIAFLYTCDGGKDIGER